MDPGGGHGSWEEVVDPERGLWIPRRGCGSWEGVVDPGRGLSAVGPGMETGTYHACKKDSQGPMGKLPGLHFLCSSQIKCRW